MLACGTTTCEVKSGYGLEVDAELRMLRALARLQRQHQIDIVPTFMGAHEIPKEYRRRRDAFVDLVVEEMIPAVAGEKLAEWCDVFCETGVFTVAESVKILEAGKRFGLAPRVHADELGPSGGSLAAAQVGARSADHLIFVPAEGIAAMAFIPLVSRGRVIGKFMLYFDAPHIPSADDVQVASLIAAQVAFAVERKRAEQARLEAVEESRRVSERLAAIVESSGDAIVSKTLDGIVTSWNQAAERLFGYSAAEMVGQPILRVIPPELQHEEVEILRKLRVGERIEQSAKPRGWLA